MSDDDDDELPPPEGAQATVLDSDLVLLALPRLEPALPDVLTEAEAAIALLVFEGASNQQIASQRGASPSTVANQLDSIYRKLGVTTRAELVVRLTCPPWDEEE